MRTGTLGPSFDTVGWRGCVEDGPDIGPRMRSVVDSAVPHSSRRAQTTSPQLGPPLPPTRPPTPPNSFPRVPLGAASTPTVAITERNGSVVAAHPPLRGGAVLAVPRRGTAPSANALAAGLDHPAGSPRPGFKPAERGSKPHPNRVQTTPEQGFKPPPKRGPKPPPKRGPKPPPKPGFKPPPNGGFC